MTAITIDTVVGAYTASREKIRALEAEIDKIKATQAKREEWLLAELAKLGAQNVKTPHGTVYQAVKESVTVGEWDAVLDWVLFTPITEVLKEFDVPEELLTAIKAMVHTEYLNKAVNKTAVLEHMGEKRDNPPPAGVNYVAVRTAQIRKG